MLIGERDRPRSWSVSSASAMNSGSVSPALVELPGIGTRAQIADGHHVGITGPPGSACGVDQHGSAVGSAAQHHGLAQPDGELQTPGFVGRIEQIDDVERSLEVRRRGVVVVASGRELRSVGGDVQRGCGIADRCRDAGMACQLVDDGVAVRPGLERVRRRGGGAACGARQGAPRSGPLGTARARTRTGRAVPAWPRSVRRLLPPPARPEPSRGPGFVAAATRSAPNEAPITVATSTISASAAESREPR